ncbi:DUF5683 domain-containing protein [Bacteroidales bacterium OttesenSCG-928-A17]|nr:DUF5683 domain-containing protein [Bacteroidales bacterium OttesenSCG-928-A17]
MKNLRLYIAATCIAFFLSASMQAQERAFEGNDSIQILDGFLAFEDSLAVDSITLSKELPLIVKKQFVPNPNKAVIYAAVFPGLGQIYNRKYWKLPLVYGSVIGCAYAITWNGGQYSGYKDAYSDFRYAINYTGKPEDFDPKRNSWEDYIYIMNINTTDLSDGSAWNSNTVNRFSQVLKSRRDRFRRYRDLSYIVSVGFYAIWIIDAYVDAQLFSFDISEDLSLNVQPVILEKTTVNKNTVGLQWSFTF